MPLHTIQTTEYECSRCGYLWIGRKNGEERKILPNFCPKCKTWMWNIPRKYDMDQSWRYSEIQRFSRDHNEGESMESFFKRTKKDRTPYPCKYSERD
jgi:hypothetical protein